MNSADLRGALTPEEIQKNFGIVLNDYEITLLLKHLHLLIKYNAYINLTRIVDEKSAIDLHIMDSLSVVRFVNQAPAGRYLDLGTGGGYPGIPVAICTDRTAILLDATRKKVEVVQSLIEEIGLSSQVISIAARAEEYAQHHKSEIAVITARAVSQAASLVELASPLLIRGGHLIVMKGNPQDEEIAKGDVAAKIVGMQRILKTHFLLSDKGYARTIIIYEKIKNSQIKLPRRNGMAQHQPLG